VFETYDEVGESPKNIFAVGGGTKNQVWAHATSDVSGKTQIIRTKTMGASYGNAFLAAVAVGDAKVSDIARWNPVAAEFKPDAATAGVYGKQYRTFRELYERNKDLMKG
jgi:xylulokinase